MGALVFSGFLVAIGEARADAPALPALSAQTSSISVTQSRDSLTTTTSAQGDGSRTQLALDKMDPSLQQTALNAQKGYSSVLIYTTNMPELAKALENSGARIAYTVDGNTREERFVARPWGAQGPMVSIYVQVPNPSLLDIASLAGVDYIQQRQQYAAAIVQDQATAEDRASFESVRNQIRAGTLSSSVGGPLSQKGGGSVSPASWAIAREHKAYDVWRDLGYEGDGVNVAVVDTGEDFGNPALMNSWAVEQNPASPYFGWPIMFHPASMEGLMGNGWWTAASDLDRQPVPFWLSVNDGDSWYSNTDYRANDSNLDGYLVYAHGTPDPMTGLTQYTPRNNPLQYGNFRANYNSRINRNYYVGCAGLPGPCILSQSGIYHLGVNRDDTLTGLWGEKVGILVVDSTTPDVYDTVYVDLNDNYDFTDDKPVTRSSPLATADIFNENTGRPGQDGVADVSGGLLYFISSSTSVTGETVIATATGTETSATLANRDIAVDIDGWFSFQPPARLWLRPPTPGPNLYLPGATEDIYEEFQPTAANETGTTWDLGGPLTSFGPINAITGQAVDSARLLRGPDTNYNVSLVYDIRDCNPALPPTNPNQCQAMAAGATKNYTIALSTGTITWRKDIAATHYVFIEYQLNTYTLEPVSGRLTFVGPATSRLPAGWRVLADYDHGVPIPYSDIYGPAHGYDTFIPANGDLVAFHGDFDQQTHGSFVSSTIAAHPFGNLASPFYEVFGTAPRAKIIGIAACCNVPGPLGLFGSIEDQRNFATVGYDGLPNTGDEASIISNSFGSTTTVNTGFSFEDRWLYNFTTNNPTTTILIAFGNNGAGYATGAPGGTSPGVITVGAGTSGDYRVLIGSDGGQGAYEFPFCPGPPPIDPKNCVGVGPGPGPYGEVAYFSSRGPTLLGQPKPDIVSIGSFAVEAAPLNAYCTNVTTGRPDPSWCDGNFAFDIFSGTSQATPVTAGIVALSVQAYRDHHAGAEPTNVQTKSALKAGADDMHRDILQQGAGWTNALRTVKIMAEMDGITSSSHFWIPGSYQGVKRPAFVNFLAAGTSDQATITVTNHHPTLAKTVQVTDAVYQRMIPGMFSYSTSVGTGTSRNYILKSDGIYAGNGATLLMAEPWTTQWNTADFTKVTWSYDPAAYTATTALRLDVFDWYDYPHPVGAPLGIYVPNVKEFVAEARITAKSLAVLGTNGSTKATLFDPAVQALTTAPYSFSRSSVGPIFEIPGPCGPFVDPLTYWIDTAAGKIVLCAPLDDNEVLSGTYEVYDLVLSGNVVSLAHTGIVPGSETVYLNGAIWPSANYGIDYVTGVFTFRTELAAGDLVEIDYVWDHPGIYDGFSERNRMTVDTFGTNANSVHDSFGQLPTKIHDGLVLNMRTGAGSAVPMTLIVEFYQKADWSWLTESTGSILVAANRGTQTFTVTASVPTTAGAGLYEGAVYLRDGTETTTIPVLINVPVTGFPITFGGNLPTTSLYDNNGVIQGARSGWRQIGDSRYVWANLNLATNVPGRKMIYNALLQGRLSDPDMLVFNCVPDANGYTTDATYGPCRMNQFSGTKEQVGATNTLFPNKELLVSNVVTGLIAFQLKAYGSMGTAGNGGTEPFTTSVGIMQATINGPGNPLGATEISTSTNRLMGSVPVTVWSNVPLYGGLGSATTITTTTTLPNQRVNQDDPNNPYTCSYRYPITLSGVITITVTIAGQAGTDIDLYIFRDANNNGLDPSDPIVGVSGSPTPNEQVTLGFPADGAYIIGVHGWSVPGGSTTFTMTIGKSAVAAGSAFSLVNAPTTDIAPNTAVQVGIGWSLPVNQTEGVIPGQVFISPGFAPYSLAILMTVTLRYDLTPVTVQDFAPTPGSTTSDPYSQVVANVYDTAIRQINIGSARLWVDGIDVTQVTRRIPTFTDAVTCCYNLLTLAFEPPTRLTDGPHSAAIEVSDLAGNLARASWSWTVDTTPPTITLTSPAGDGATNQAAFTVRGTAPSAASVTVNGNSVAVDSITGAFSTALTLLPGANAIVVVATDSVGNAATATRVVTLDTTVPSLMNVRSSEPARTNRDSTVISGTVGESVTSLTVSGLAVPVHDDGSFAVRMPLAEGTNTFVVSATDLAGNPNSVTVVVTRDTVAPVITLDAPSPSDFITNLNTIAVNISGTVPGSDVTLVTVNGFPVTLDANRHFVRQFVLTLGANVFVVEAKDDAGNSAMATTTVTYAPTVVDVQRSYTGYILTAVAVVLLIVGFLVGWMLKGSRGPPSAPEMAPSGGPPPMETTAPEPEEMPAEEEMTTEEEEL